MPNRILREGILTSERIDQLAFPAEVFYRRLMSVVDDFGRYYAKPELLLAGLYPLRVTKVRIADIATWLADAQAAGLVRTYRVENKDYLELLDFHQQVRATKSKFPQPPSDAEQVNSGCVADAQQPRADAHLVVDVDEVRIRERASRLPSDWRLSTEQIEWAIGAQPTWDAEYALRVGEKFRDYWIAKPGKQGTKLDWDATWRNWVRNEPAAKARPADPFKGVT